VISDSATRQSFAAGEWSIVGRWWFFPYCLLIKTPLALFAMVILAAAAAWRTGVTWGSFYRTAPLWILLVVYWAFALTSNLNIGHRHILPTYPVMFILAGAAAGWFAARGVQWVKYVVMIAMMGLAAESLSIYPHYLAFFNVASGGPAQGYRHLVDSSLDWGQDLPELKQYLDAHGLNDQQERKVYYCYFGTASAKYHGIEATQLPGYWRLPPSRVPEVLQPGVYCISVTMLQSLYTPSLGPWCRPYEIAYRERLADVQRLAEARPNPDTLAALLTEHDEGWLRVRCMEFERLRVGRLCSYLRSREPVAQVGYSINVYELDRTALLAAQFEAIPNMLDKPAVRGQPE